MESERAERIEQRREPQGNPPTEMEHREHRGRDASTDMAAYKQRFDNLQLDFIEHPKETVEKAEKLVEEAVERIVSSMHERVNRIHSELGDKTDDTERLRLAMRGYREFVDTYLKDRAA